MKSYIYNVMLGVVITITTAAVVLGLVIVWNALPDESELKETTEEYPHCQLVAVGESIARSDHYVDFHLQRCVVPDGVCYVTSDGGLFCMESSD